ncbi:hypothetical protein KW786_04065 [Candidatus Parcubacteria bacterium]|nr:hypothetical protein [Candidatus Parcubacteria bacterium]
MSWDQIYDYLGVKEFIYFISSPSIQDQLFPVKIVFIGFTIFFFCAVIWFYLNSTYVQYMFLQDTTEFFSRNTYGMRAMNRNLKKIKRKAEGGTEPELKLAIIEADDFLLETLQDADYKGDTFEELIESAGKKMSAENLQQILEAHGVRNSIVYDQDFKLDAPTAKRLLALYEVVINSVALG